MDPVTSMSIGKCDIKDTTCYDFANLEPESSGTGKQYKDSMNLQFRPAIERIDR